MKRVGRRFAGLERRDASIIPVMARRSLRREVDGREETAVRRAVRGQWNGIQ